VAGRSWIFPPSVSVQPITGAFNVVFRGPTPSRLTIACGPDWPWMRQAGREVAEFLGVPLVDRLYHG
jgi:hypothetical protein